MNFNLNLIFDSSPRVFNHDFSQVPAKPKILPLSAKSLHSTPEGYSEMTAKHLNASRERQLFPKMTEMGTDSEACVRRNAVRTPRERRIHTVALRKSENSSRALPLLPKVTLAMS